MIDAMIRISVLWIFLAVANSIHYLLMLVFEPSILQKPLSEETTSATKRLAIAEAFGSWLVPLTMAFLSVTLGDLANRDLNMVLGGFYTLLSIIHIARCPMVHISNKPAVYQLLIVGSTIVVTALIFWYAWSW
jgi:hypothetical protein